MKRTKLRLPREHGAWAMLLVPMAAGSLAARRFNLPLLLLALSATSVFIARESLLEWWRAKSRNKPNANAFRAMLAYSLFGVLAGAPLLAWYRLYWITGFGLAAAALLAINANQAVKREDRSIAGEVLAIAGLTLGGPAAYYASSSTLGETAMMLWLMCALYFTSSVFYVKFRVSLLNRRREELRRRSWRNCALYHAFLVVAIGSLAATGSLNLFVFVAFVPVLARSFWYLAKPSVELNLRSIGIQEIVYSLIFLAFATMSLTQS